jgi:5'-3' exonuclease
MVNQVNVNGNHIGGLTGFLKSVGYAIKMINPTKTVIVFDGVGSSNSKRNLFPDYKANRHLNRVTNYSIFSSKEEENESISNQMARLIQYLKCLPVTVVSIDGLEADDIIGYLCKQFEKYDQTQEITIMSADKDFLQLASNKTTIYSPTKKKIYKPKDVLEEFGVSSTNYLNYKILLGDKSDNVPGVNGLGPVKIVKLFPKLIEDKKISLEEIVSDSFDKRDENKLYLSVVERRHQLVINERLMSLDGSILTDSHKQLVKDSFNNGFILNKYLFNQLYINDKLGDSIPNVDGWLNESFGYLNTFN